MVKAAQIQEPFPADDDEDDDDDYSPGPRIEAPNPDLLLAGFAPTVSFKTIGDFVAGKILKTETLQRRSIRHPERVLYWPDGQPKWQIVITLEVTKMQPAPELGTDESAVIERRLFVKIPGGIRTAISGAMKNAGVRSLEMGHYLRVEYIDNGAQPNKAMNPPKVYGAEYV